MHRFALVAALASSFACKTTASSADTGDDTTSDTGATSAITTGAGTTTAVASETAVDPDTTAASSAAPTTGPTDPCGGDGSTCVPAPGPDWVGPLMLRETGGEMAPGCEAPYASVSSTVYSDLLAPPAECGCSCEAAGVPSCPPVHVTYWLSDNCVGASNGTWNLTTTCNAAVNFSSGTSGRADPIPVEGASCSPAPTVEVQPPAFDHQFVLCAPEAELTACDGGSCAPAVPVDDGQLCVVREGDFACPSDWDGARYLRYRTFADTRGCSECTCTPYSANCAGYSVVLFPTNDCSGLPIDSLAPSGNCHAIDSAVSSARVSAGVMPVVDCGGHESGGEAIGSAGPLMPVTVCCAG